MAALASRTSEPVERNTCTARDLRIISRLVLSCTLLCAGASSGSAESRSRSACRARPPPVPPPSGSNNPACRTPRGTWPSRQQRRAAEQLHLAGARARGVHLGQGGHGDAVDAPVALEHDLREEAAGTQLRDAQRQRSDAGGERPLAVAVSAVRPRP